MFGFAAYGHWIWTASRSFYDSSHGASVQIVNGIGESVRGRGAGSGATTLRPYVAQRSEKAQSWSSEERGFDEQPSSSEVLLSLQVLKSASDVQNATWRKDKARGVRGVLRDDYGWEEA